MARVGQALHLAITCAHQRLVEFIFWLVPLSPFSLSKQAYTHTYAQDLVHFEEVMDQLGVSVGERKSIEELAFRSNQTSKRNTNPDVPLTPFSPNKIQFLKELETWQHRPYQTLCSTP